MSMIETDYLIVGAGAAGMAFADSLITHSNADVVMVERRHSPGGHWNDAYPFVRIHHASACYAVNSTPLGNDMIETTGINAGMYERATGTEVCAYFQQVLDSVLLPSGQVRYFGMSDYIGDWEREHAFTSRVSGHPTQVHVRRKIIDTTYLEVAVPATHTPSFAVDDDANCIPVGALTEISKRPGAYVTIGAGKTAMDACLWLLDNGEDPDRIRWIIPRAPLVMDRMALQPRELVTECVDGLSQCMEVLANAESIDAIWPQLEAHGQMSRLHQEVPPEMFRGPVVNAIEREQLRSIGNIIRLGRVKTIGRDHIEMEKGKVPTGKNQLHVDCTARGFSRKPLRPIFEPHRIVLQSLSGGFTAYYAALHAFIETSDRDGAEKNRLCPPVAQSTYVNDWIHLMRGFITTGAMHGAESDIAAWNATCRLSLTMGMEKHMDNPRMQAALRRWETYAEAALDNADRLLNQQAPLN